MAQLATVQGSVRTVASDGPRFEDYELLGVRLSAVTMEDLHRAISRAVEEDSKLVVVSQNLHGVYVYHRNAKMRALHARAIPRIDGMSLVMVGRLLGLPLRREHRITWVDWIDPLMSEAQRNGWRVFYLGSKPNVVARGAEVLRARYPKLEIVARDGYFDARPGSEGNDAVLDDIARMRPHILMVGMGMPRQEEWVYDNLGRIEANAILTCGAAIDYVAGMIPTPPRWMGRVGLEWLYRLVSEPRRLGYRYLVEPWYLVGLFLRDLWTKRLMRR